MPMESEKYGNEKSVSKQWGNHKFLLIWQSTNNVLVVDGIIVFYMVIQMLSLYKWCFMQ